MKKILFSSLLLYSTIVFAQDNPIKGKLITGGYFTEDNNFETKDLFFTDENDCKYLGNGTYSFFNKNIQIELFKKSCLENGKVITTDIKGYIMENKEKGIHFSTEFKNNYVIHKLVPNNDIEIILN